MEGLNSFQVHLKEAKVSAKFVDYVTMSQWRELDASLAHATGLE